MKTHPLDPVALIAGLFFLLSGVAMLADRQWDDLDVTALTAAVVAVVALALTGMIVYRFVRDVAESSHEPPGDAEA